MSNGTNTRGDAPPDAQERQLQAKPPEAYPEQSNAVVGWMDFTDGQRALKAAEVAIKSRMVPSCFTQPAQVLIAVQTGAEAGLTPMASVRSVYVVNGAPAWVTEAARALVKRGFYDALSGKVTPVLMPGTDIEEGVEHVGHEAATANKEDCTDDCHGWAATHPLSLGGVRIVTTFSVAEAKTAGLWKKTGPWQQYPMRMLRHRAVGFHLKDHYPGVMLGLPTQAEIEDWPQAAFRRPIGLSPVSELAEPPVDPLQGGAEVVSPEASESAEELPEVAPQTSDASEEADASGGPDFELEGEQEEEPNA